MLAARTAAAQSTPAGCGNRVLAATVPHCDLQLGMHAILPHSATSKVRQKRLFTRGTDEEAAMAEMPLSELLALEQQQSTPQSDDAQKTAVPSSNVI
eukprot:365800-Chlamydomonas_euryale.AAC.11